MTEHISISRGNSKMGAISSVSFPPIITCIKCDCNKLCYANKHAYKLYKNVKIAYDKNWEIYQTNKDLFWREVKATIMTSRIFRWFVSGDIPDYNFVIQMINIMKENPHCESICFTKKFSLINRYLNEGGEIPANLHLIFSGWRNLEIDNPYKLPECHVLFEDGYTTARDGAKICSGNCTECFYSMKNCFALKKGEQIIIKQH